MEPAPSGVNVVDASVQSIGIQFQFANPHLIPKFIKEVPDSAEEEQRRRNSPAGIRFIESTPNVDAAAFLEGIYASGYQLTDAFYQPRAHPQHSTQTVHVVRFVFHRKEDARPTRQFLNVVLLIKGALENMCKDAMWSLFVYRNPVQEGGAIVAGKSSLSVNLTARRPYCDAHGEPMMVWPKKPDGRKTEMFGKVKLGPDFFLRLEGGEISMVPVAAPQLQAAETL